MSNPPSVLIAGCGDVGSRLGLQLHARGWTVYGLRRNTAALPEPIHPVAGDLERAEAPAAWPTGELDYLVYAASANQHDEAGYQAAYVRGLSHVLGWLAGHGQRPRRLLFVSSTSVYGQHEGEWVDETSATEPAGFSGRIMLQAERQALDSGLPASVVRLSGIYGPGRQALLRQVRNGYRPVSEPPLYGNRIHVDDAAGLLAFLLLADAGGAALERCYLGVDDAPAPLAEVVDWLRERLGVTHSSEEAGMRRSGSKRCSNARARALGWSPRYPSYRDGYAAIIAERGATPA
ncbi:SDR family NAD(P)-dependent oxidoreductase [Stutzerimonas nosocomialis]|uniref:NAD-dependent epimerase/dehydratase family protein n=1 Tax=Stutzerimonas nosocomialis TaxID=1056496 RepID=UPI00110889B6|nr:NAD-dependent epimerase/dehydratase family protein [Stutzerimonas nosocomialis]TLX57655.1 SDR family NAD(P)-dependent oxidoreductase [Stutzerimonas nosocomialis]